MDNNSNHNKDNLINLFIESRDPELRNDIVVEHLPLVYYVVSRLGYIDSHGQDREDLISQGVLGLISSVDGYDPKHGTKFSTYAIIRIKGKILDYLRTQDWLPRTVRKQVRDIQEAVNVFWGEIGRTPTNNELAKHLDLTSEQIEQALLYSSRIILSLDSQIGFNDDENLSIQEVVKDEKQINPSESLENKELRLQMVASLKQLSQQEQQVLSLYYYENLTYKEIGLALGVSESRVSQVHSQAVMALHVMLERSYQLDSVIEDADKKTGNLLKTSVYMMILMVLQSLHIGEFFSGGGNL